MANKQDIHKRFWSKVDKKTDEECWEWMAAKNHDGYGRFRYNDTHVGSHRMSMMLKLNRELEYNENVCHKCDNTSCVNPNHLFIGSSSENQLDCVSKGRHSGSIKTHCKHGHEFTEDNTFIDGKGKRSCRLCRKLASLSFVMRKSY